ncbi:outer membrane receptor for ferric coprogen and ferric-rhodotorulic acid [Hephaestia caeni]|uniref:Outer membrane receptor for ferric coprogen and ferric-rhodotorulic acid n=1 Tax=Hephaestia caeni TaxID=645617 RepID=A0A397NGG1_9SPHN|nr:TonB-dependent siderophore receptor [Hephaestia caeni]RIA36612.1 outer membrane receptor for ferric coprogen and ferric-rhodotorulic acid [Hephaestia caeni]
MTFKFMLLLGGALAALATPAIAQTAATEDGAATPPGQSEGAIQDGAEIIVTGRYTLPDRIDTATGLGLTVRETPQSVSIITAQRIIDQNLRSVADVVENGVGVTMTEIDDVRNSFFARGFKIQNYQIDGVPTAWALAGSAGETIADVSIYDRVEIVRGATGLLSGAGDPSASVNLVRKHADRADWGGYVNASYGSWDTWQVSGDIGGAVTADGRLRIRAVGRYEQGDSYIDLYRNKKLVLYGTLDADVTDDTLLRVGFSHQQGRPDAPAWGALPSFYGDGSFAAWPRSKTASADWAFWDTTNQNFFATLRHDFGSGWSAQVNYNRLRNAERTNILYIYGTVDKDTGLGLASNPFADEGESIQNSYDAQIKGRIRLFGRDHDIVLGALDSTINRYTNTFQPLNITDPANPYSFPPAGDFNNWDGDSYPYPGFSDVPSLQVKERIKQTGYYGALRLNLADSLKLIGGGRLASWKQNGFSYNVSSDYGDDDVFIPYVGALYDLASNHRLYASYTTIFQPQSALDRDFRQLDPLDGKAYEVGLKSAFFGDALQTSIALFRIEQDNVAQPDGAPVPPPGGGIPQQTYIAADGVVSKGFEVEITGRPLEGWNVNFGYSQFNAEDADGNKANADQPRRLLKLFTTYTFPGALDRLTIGGGVNYRSKAYSEGDNPVTGAPFRFQQDGYTLVNLMARFAVSERLQLQANVENLLDKRYFSQIGFYSQYRYGAPRNVTIGANYRF